MRFGAIVAAVGLCCLIVGSPAMAQASPAPGVHSASTIVSAQASVSTSVIGSDWTAYFPDTRLVTDPVRVTIGKVSYRMVITVFRFTHHRAPTQVEVKLRRTVRSPSGAQHAWQQYVYVWPQGAHLTAGDDLHQATVSSGPALTSSRIALRFTASQPALSQPCQTASGKLDNRTLAQGQLTISALRLHTPTSPFFGDITTRPLTATVISDPGCRRPFNLQACPGKYSLVAVRPHGNRFWIADSNKTESRVYEGVLDLSQGPPELTAFVDGAVSGKDLTVTHSPSGAQGTLLTTGHAFISGSATFTSRTRALLSEPTCVQRGVRHKYHQVEYRGTLAPTASTTLTAMFDAKPLRLTAPTPATLDVVTRWVS